MLFWYLVNTSVRWDIKYNNKFSVNNQINKNIHIVTNLIRDFLPNEIASLNPRPTFYAQAISPLQSKKASSRFAQFSKPHGFRLRMRYMQITYPHLSSSI